jgi:cytidylate kinase
MIARDQADASRAIAPLKCADDAVLIDSTDMDIDQVLEAMANTIWDKTR